MAQQFDFTTAVDLNGIVTPSKAQLMQALYQIAPLSNIGGVIVGSSTPDIANNARFSRYLWIDTTDTTNPILKVYNGSSWVNSALNADAVSSSHIAQGAVAIYDASGYGTKKVALRESGGADAGKAAYILRLDGAGEYVEAVSLSTILSAASSIAVTALAGGSDNQFLRINGATPQWETVTIANEIINGTLALAKLAAGTPNEVLNYDGSGNPQSSTMDTLVALLSARTIPLTALKQGGASANQLLHWNNSALAWEAADASFASLKAEVVTGSTLNNAQDQIAHSLGTIPSIVRIVAVLDSSDTTSTESTSYSVGDEIDIFNLLESTTGEYAFRGSADASNVNIVHRDTSAPAIQILHKTTAQAGRGAIDETLWSWKAYLIK